MRPGIVTREVVHGHLVGVPKIEDVLLEAQHGAQVQGPEELVIQETVRYPGPVIVLVPVELPELEVQVRTAPVIAAEHLVIDGGLKLQAALLWAVKGIAGIYLVVQQQVGLRYPNVLIYLLLQYVIGIEAEEEPFVPVQYPHVKIVVVGGPVVRYDGVRDRWLVGAIVKSTDIDPEIVYIIGYPER